MELWTTKNENVLFAIAHHEDGEYEMQKIVGQQLHKDIGTNGKVIRSYYRTYLGGIPINESYTPSQANSFARWFLAELERQGYRIEEMV